MINDRGLLKRQTENGCICGGCGKDRWTPADCRGCGFDYKEDLRRKKLPMTELENGLYGKKIGRGKRC